MQVFWERGYEGTSLTDLTQAMGIASPSLYAAFGNKEALFREAVAHYNATHGTVPQRALEKAPTARAAIEELLQYNAYAYVEPGHPTGCLVLLAATTGAVKNDHIRHFMAACRTDDLTNLQRRIERGVAEGDVPPDTESATLARFIMAMLQGMSAQARDGADQAALSDIVTCAMAAWDAMTGRPAGAADG